MGNSKMDKTTKEESKTTPASTQEQSPTTSSGTVNPDWSGFQAYSPMPHHGFLASSPQAHPYMWGVQHIMPPYGTPPYVAMYPHGGIYAHPSIPPGPYPFSPFAAPSPNGITEASGNTQGGLDTDVKHSDAKEKLPIKRSKGSLGSLNMITGKNNEFGKMSGASANGIYSKSADSASEGTSEGSDDNSDNDSQLKTSRGQDSSEAATFQNGSSVHGGKNGGPNGTSMANQSMAVIPAAGVPGSVTGPTTILNIGMDYWGAPTSSAIPPALKGNPVATGSRDQSQHWLQDEREQKRQRRKQSNRESARRSRLRKQAECDELAQRAEVLKDENANLRSEVNRIRSEYEQLLLENSSLKEKLAEIPEKEPSDEKKQTTQSELAKGEQRRRDDEFRRKENKMRRLYN